jgi:hypothetical protein
LGAAGRRFNNLFASAWSTDDGSQNWTLTSSGNTDFTFSRSGSEKMRITQGSNVGIGTTSPGSILSINGIANFTSATSTFYSTGGLNLTAGCFAISGNCLGLGNIGGALGVSQGGTGQTSFGQGWLNSDGTTLSASTSPTINYLTATSTTATSSIATGGFLIGSNNFVVQQTSGRVGIGTNAPQDALTLNGSIGVTSDKAGSLGAAGRRFNNLFASAWSTDDGSQNWTLTSSGNTDFTFSRSGSEKMRITQGSNVGIGTSSPLARLDVAGANNGTTSLFQLSSVASFATTTQFIVNNNGNAGIGTSTPYARLEVWGTDTGSTSAFVVANSASTTVFAVYNNGNATYSGSIFQSSDQRLKTDIQSLDASSSLSFIDALNPVSYVRLDQPGQGSHLGFVAQEVQRIFPQLVSTTSPTSLTPDGTLTLNYVGLIAPIVRAIQALGTELASLEQTVAGFADSFTTKELTFTRATGDELTVKKLCVTDGPTDQSPLCVTKAQLAAVLAGTNPTASTPAPSGGSETPAPDTAPPIIGITGGNPAIIHIGDSYADLGATITGPQADLNLGIRTYLNGTLTSNIVIDTSTVATDTIDYVATDQPARPQHPQEPSSCAHLIQHNHPRRSSSNPIRTSRRHPISTSISGSDDHRTIGPPQLGPAPAWRHS